MSAEPTGISPRGIFLNAVLDHFGDHQECGPECTHADTEERAAIEAWRDFQMVLAECKWEIRHS